MLNKKERKKLRYERNVRKEKEYKESAWESGKLIEENHNGKSYSAEYTEALTTRLIEYLNQEREKSLLTSNPEIEYIRRFRKLKRKIIDLIILWSPEVKYDDRYYYLKELLETYWDEVLGNNNLSSLLNYGKR